MSPAGASGSASAAPLIVLDASVLVPPLLRCVLLGLAGAGLLRPRVSPRILEEWRRAAARSGPEAATEARAAAAALLRAFPEALAQPGPLPPVGLPDPADEHVLALARSLGAEGIMTLNRKDFPRRALARHALAVHDPDLFALRALAESPAAVRAVVEDCLAHHAPGRAPRSALRRAGLGRLGRALAPE